MLTGPHTQIPAARVSRHLWVLPLLLRRLTVSMTQSLVPLLRSHTPKAIVWDKVLWVLETMEGRGVGGESLHKTENKLAIDTTAVYCHLLLQTIPPASLLPLSPVGHHICHPNMPLGHTDYFELQAIEK